MSIHAYYTDHCTLSVPAGFRDRTANVLEWTTPEGDAIALVIQREELPGRGPEGEGPSADDLERYVQGQTKDYSAQFPSFHSERDEIAMGDWGFPMHRKAFRWRRDQDVFYHHQAFVLAGAHAVVFTGAAKARHRALVDALIEDALKSFRVRSD